MADKKSYLLINANIVDPIHGVIENATIHHANGMIQSVVQGDIPVTPRGYVLLPLTLDANTSFPA